MPDPTGVKARIVRHLATSGPLWGDVAAEQLGLTLEQWSTAVLNCSWVTFDEASRPAGWTVTERGQRDVLDATRGAPAATAGGRR